MPLRASELRSLADAKGYLTLVVLLLSRLRFNFGQQRGGPAILA